MILVCFASIGGFIVMMFFVFDDSKDHTSEIILLVERQRPLLIPAPSLVRHQVLMTRLFRSSSSSKQSSSSRPSSKATWTGELEYCKHKAETKNSHTNSVVQYTSTHRTTTYCCYVSVLCAELTRAHQACQAAICNNIVL